MCVSASKCLQDATSLFNRQPPNSPGRFPCDPPGVPGKRSWGICGKSQKGGGAVDKSVGKLWITLWKTCGYPVDNFVDKLWITFKTPRVASSM